ncbi:MAG: LacI family DNA-binding transcriptional regulator [Planctomycetota bacterium]
MTTKPVPSKDEPRPSLSDVAVASEVAVSTASRVLNGKTKNFSVRADVRERILTNAKRLGYRPNINAQTLRRNTTGYVAVLGLRMLSRAIHDPADSVIDLIAERLAKNGLHLTTTFVSGDEDGYDLPPWQVDAAVVVRATREDDFRHVERTGLPYVSLNTPAGPSGSAVLVDDRAAMHELLGHLQSRGHRRIAYASHPDADPHVSQADRLSAYIECIHAAGQTPLHLRGGSPDSMAEPLQAALEHGTTAIVTYNHFMAANLVAATAERGVSVPGQMSIATYNDEYPVRHLSPSITSVGHPKEQMADEAVRLLLEATGKQKSSPETLRLPMQLVPRRSTGVAVS